MATILSTEVPKIIGKIPNVISKYILLSIQMRNIDRIITDVWSPNWLIKNIFAMQFMTLLMTIHHNYSNVENSEKSSFIRRDI